MSIEWYRQYHGTPTDPKWRLVSRRSGAPLCVVVALWTLMEDYASQQAERGSLVGWDDEVAGAALDIDPDQVRAVREAMQGLTLTGDRLSAWERRQPRRERENGDDSSDRVRRHRERQAATANADETPCNANAGQETPRLEKRREEKNNSDANASGAPAPDPVKALLDFGVSVFTAAGRSEREARTLLGRLRKDAADDSRLMGLLIGARNQSAVEPFAYVKAALTRERQRQKMGTGYVPLGVGG